MWALWPCFLTGNSEQLESKKNVVINELFCDNFRGLGRVSYILDNGVAKLYADNGVGKTTFTQMYLKELGVTGVVKSPTYTFVEEYELNDIYVYHFDLYRLSDPDELEFLGFDDYRVDNSILVIEWPERAAGYIRDIDLEIKIEFMGERRVATILSRTNKGETVIECL